MSKSDDVLKSLDQIRDAAKGARKVMHNAYRGQSGGKANAHEAASEVE